MCRQWCVVILVAAATWIAAVSAQAGYNWGGDGMEEVASGTISNGAVFMQSYGAWGSSYTNSSSGYSTQFTAPACNDVVDARLVLGIYGGSANNLASPLTVTVNGVATSGTVGGGTSSPDKNPEFTANQTNVYGSMSSGAWVVSIPVTGDLNTNGSANNVNVKISSATGFDGRIVYASLWDVYQKASLDNTFQYAVAEGSGDIYTTTPVTAQSPTVASRWVNMGAFNTSNLQSATLDVLYTYVHSGQDNHLYINSNDASNGTLLGGDPAVSSNSTYAPVQASFDVTPDLSALDNWIKFSVDPADGVIGSGTDVFRPQVAILEATSAAAPEPGTMALLTAGGLFLLVWRRWRMNHKSPAVSASPCREDNMRPRIALFLGCIAIMLSAVQPSVAHGQTYTVLQSFDGANGANPTNGSLTVNGSTLYGMTSSGGSSGNGNIFSINTNGSNLQSLYSFSGGADGASPQGSLALIGSTLYGMTCYGGGSGNGNIFSINTNGSGFQNLHPFNGADGMNPYGSLTAGGSTLYGMTCAGGSSYSGNVFSINTSGASFQNLCSFSGGADGSYPFGSLTSGGSTLYGMTSGGGSSYSGNVFSIGANGSGLQNLYSFSGGADGQYPAGDLTLIGSTLYGMTWSGGASGKGNIFSVKTDGSGFQNLFSFNGADGANPNGDLTLIGSTLYGMTESGGGSGLGTIFSINTDGTDFRNLLSFNGADGENPWGSLTAIGSTLYGMTSSGGDNNDGVVFSLTTTVPEPSTFALLSVAAIGLVGCYWRWKTRKI